MNQEVFGFSARHANRLIQEEMQNLLNEASGPPFSPVVPDDGIEPFAYADDVADVDMDQIPMDWSVIDDGQLMQEEYESDDEVVDDMHVVDDEDVQDVQEDTENVDEEATDTEPPHIVRLRKWAMLCNVPHRHVSQLLKVLNTSHGNYPLDARTLLRTPRQPTKSITMTPGDYFHYGLKSGLLSYPPKF